MSDREDEAVDRLLLEHFEGPVPDDGFCDSVMRQLPARRRHRAWPLALGAAIGCVLCWLSLLSAPLLRIGWQDLMSGEWSAPTVVLLVTTACVSLLALAWTSADTEDRSWGM